ncbi:MAG TPA: MBL fold metallo-hydrolase [Propionibacteriaceae bacterium]|nr:MBL fold metallo-hydrolase [Propionibacteriaceae bacterium]
MSPAEQPSVTWRPVRDGVYMTTLEPARVNCGLVVGRDGALLVDTGSSPEQGAALRRSVATVTQVPLRHVVVTHHHWDHAFGLAAFADVETIGHESVAATLASEDGRTTAADHGLDADSLAVPSTSVSVIAARDLGGLHVEIGHFGAGHTGGDLAVLVPEARVLFAGDLVEQGDPPQVDETTSMRNWPRVMEALLTLCKPDTVVVPGHGDPVDAHFISWEGTGLDAIYGQCEWLVGQGVAEDSAYEHPELQWPWDETWARHAIARAYAELAAAGHTPSVRTLPIQAVPRA